MSHTNRDGTVKVFDMDWLLETSSKAAAWGRRLFAGLLLPPSGCGAAAESTRESILISNVSITVVHWSSFSFSCSLCVLLSLPTSLRPAFCTFLRFRFRLWKLCICQRYALVALRLGLWMTKLSSPKEVGGFQNRGNLGICRDHRGMMGGSVREDMSSSWTYEPMRMDYSPDFEHSLSPSVRA